VTVLTCRKERRTRRLAFGFEALLLLRVRGGCRKRSGLSCGACAGAAVGGLTEDTVAVGIERSLIHWDLKRGKNLPTDKGGQAQRHNEHREKRETSLFMEY